MQGPHVDYQQVVLDLRAAARTKTSWGQRALLDLLDTLEQRHRTLSSSSATNGPLTAGDPLHLLGTPGVMADGAVPRSTNDGESDDHSYHSLRPR